MSKILVVDDEAPLRRLVGQILERNSYDCVLAADAAEAREYVGEENFHLLLCDIRMPGESGLDFTRDVLNGHSNMAAIMVTAVDDPVVAGAALEIGAYGYITKPIERNELLINVAYALRRRQLEIDSRNRLQSLERMVSEQETGIKTTDEGLEQTCTACQEARSQIIHSDRMISAGQFAEGVTDEINTPVGLGKADLNLPKKKNALVPSHGVNHGSGVARQHVYDPRVNAYWRRLVVGRYSYPGKSMNNLFRHMGKMLK